MKRSLKSYLEGILLLLITFFIFLLLFESYIQIPLWVNPLGRLHPLVLHFPIVLMILALLIDAFRPKYNHETEPIVKKYSNYLVLIAVLTSVIAASSGMFLSQEEGYEGETLNWHKWTGSAMAILGYIYYLFRNKVLEGNIYLKRTPAFGLILILILTGHFGASLTHGENFVFENFSKTEDVAFEDAEVFAHLVQPIFETKCVSCHNNQKMKGELLLNNIENIKKGGKSGHFYVAGEPEKSLLIKRIFLDPAEKEHMPPLGKTQLTLDEKQILKWWVQKNESFKLKVIELSKNDSLFVLAEKLFSKKNKEENYDFKHADADLIKKLNNEYRVITPLSKTSPALDLTLFNSKFYNSSSLEELSGIKEQIVSLNLSKIPLNDSDLKIVSQFKNLNHLNLNFTNITSKGLEHLISLKKLKSLNLGDIKIDISYLENLLKAGNNLKKISLWNSNLNETQITKLKKQFPNVEIINEIPLRTLKLNLPVLKNKPPVFKDSILLQIGHPINGVTLRFTTDNTEPDSLKSNIYSPGKTVLHKTSTIKAKAFKDGWYGSDLATFTVYKNHLKPDSVALVSKLNRVHPANGSATFFDQVFGTFNANSPAWANNWAGFRNNDMELLMIYKKPTTVSEISLNFLIETETGIFPPQIIEVWGGSSEKNMKLLGKSKPLQPKELIKPFIQVSSCKINSYKGTHFKIIAKPLNPIPNWHGYKGGIALFLVDEVFVN
jgi:uncharacterized membrane protein